MTATRLVAWRNLECFSQIPGALRGTRDRPDDVKFRLAEMTVECRMCNKPWRKWRQNHGYRLYAKGCARPPFVRNWKRYQRGFELNSYQVIGFCRRACYRAALKIHWERRRRAALLHREREEEIQCLRDSKLILKEAKRLLRNPGEESRTRAKRVLWSLAALRLHNQESKPPPTFRII